WLVPCAERKRWLLPFGLPGGFGLEFSVAHTQRELPHFSLDTSPRRSLFFPSEPRAATVYGSSSWRVAGCRLKAGTPQRAFPTACRERPLWRSLAANYQNV